jgi:diguanylate cyclase (GGDEF)-like protein
LSDLFLYDLDPYTSARRTQNPNAQQDLSAPVRHLLVVEDTEDSDGPRLLPLESSSHSIGRAPTNSIVLKSKAVSRQHALLLRVTSSEPNSYGFLLIDGNLQGQRSKNGIKVNGQKCSSHRLKDRDQILLGNKVKAKYLILQSLTDEEFEAYCHSIDFDEVLHESITPSQVLASAEPNFDEADLARLASFPEIIPSPMLEVNLNGELTYLNPAAANAFPDLVGLGMEHPMLVGLFDLVQSSQSKILVREVQVARKVYEQSIHYISESDLIRSCVFDITDRKRAVEDLQQRDRLLQSVAEATTQLLANVGLKAAIDQALATLGTAARVDRICIFTNHTHPNTSFTATSLKYEWIGENIPSIKREAHRQNQLFISDHLKRWYHILTDEQHICELVRDLPEAEQKMLVQDDVLSLLVFPIIVDSEFWGFIEFHQCTEEYEWSDQEIYIVKAMASSISAAIQRQQTEELIHHQAFHDALTKLPNRTLFTDRLKYALSTAQRSNTSVAVMFMDLDRFKNINDTLGHSVGDNLLQAVAQRLHLCLREGDIVARWGGDEFTVLLPQIHTEADATNTAHRILDSLKTPFYIDSHELHVDASIGISLFPQDGKEAETLLQNADVALYRSKEQRGSSQLYSPSMNSGAPDLLYLENGLRRALEREELLLYYQPKINITTGDIVGLEALIRWEHAEMGLVSPGTFIPLAEETGLIVSIGEWVLRTACEQLVQWHQEGLTPLSVAVNLSARQFFQPNLIESITQALEETRLDPAFLEIEITETTAVKSIEFARTLLRQLQDKGVHIAMDDFGTGYSSLNYLKQLPLNTLKIDRSFICDLKPDTKDAEIIKSVISLAQGLQLQIVAEGVDNQEQLAVLRDLNCEIVQGYLFSRPLDAADITEMLRENWKRRSEFNGYLSLEALRALF